MASIQLSVTLPPTLADDIKKYAEKIDTSVSSIFRRGAKIILKGGKSE